MNGDMIERLFEILQKPQYRGLVPLSNMFDLVSEYVERQMVPALSRAFEDAQPIHFESRLHELTQQLSKTDFQINNNKLEELQDFVKNCKLTPQLLRLMYDLYDNVFTCPESPDLESRKEIFNSMYMVFDSSLYEMRFSRERIIKTLETTLTRTHEWNEKFIGATTVFFTVAQHDHDKIGQLRAAFNLIGKLVSSCYEKAIKYYATLVGLAEEKAPSDKMSQNIELITRYCNEHGIDITHWRFGDMKIYKNASSHDGFRVDYQTGSAFIYNTNKKGEENGFSKNVEELIADASWILRFTREDHELHKVALQLVLSIRQLRMAHMRNFLTTIHD